MLFQFQILEAIFYTQVIATRLKELIKSELTNEQRIVTLLDIDIKRTSNRL